MTSETNRSWKQAALRHIKAVPATVSLVGASIGMIVLWQGESWREQHINILMTNGIYWLILLHFIWHIVGHRCPEFFGIPRVKKILRSDKLIIVEKSPWLGIGVMTTLYIVEDEVERILCIGEVINVQYNDLVQIAIRHYDSNYESDDDIWKTLDRVDKKSLLVKPGSYRGGV